MKIIKVMPKNTLTFTENPWNLGTGMILPSEMWLT